MIVLTDIHGCHKTLMALLAKCPKGRQIACAGDLIDRGPDSASVVRWAMENGIWVTMGNHEHMALDWHDGFRYYSTRDWSNNGGEECLDSFDAGKLPDDVLDWMRDLPVSINYEDELLISHTGHGHREDMSVYDRVWVRDYPEYDDGLFRVFGHTPKKEPVITKDYAMIDTGCAYAKRGYGVLTAFVWPERKIIQQTCID